MKKMKGSTVPNTGSTTAKMAKVVTKGKSPVKGNEKMVKQYHASRGIVKHAVYKH